MVDLGRGEGLDVKLGIARLQAAQHLEVVLPRQLGMDASDDVDLVQLLELRLGRVGENGVEIHLPRAFGPVLSVEAAEVAVEHAHVRVVEVHVADVVADVAVLFLADVVRQAAQGEEVVRLEEADSVVEAEALAGEDFLFDIGQGGSHAGHFTGPGPPRQGGQGPQQGIELHSSPEDAPMCPLKVSSATPSWTLWNPSKGETPYACWRSVMVCSTSRFVPSPMCMRQVPFDAASNVGFAFLISENTCLPIACDRS